MRTTKGAARTKAKRRLFKKAKGYVGGRMKEDFDGNGSYHCFCCPLLGPGRPDPWN